MPEEKKMISSRELAKVLGKTDRTIQLLAKTGEITVEKIKNRNQYNLYTVVQEYIDNLTKRETRKFSSIDEEKAYEEVRYKRAKADMMELELAELDGEMHCAEDVENMTTDLALAVRSALMSLPGRLGVDVATIGDAAECSEVIKKAVCEVLENMEKHKYNEEEYKKLARERKGWKEKEQEDG